MHYYIVLIVYDDANYVTVPHTGPTGDTWKSGCDNLIPIVLGSFDIVVGMDWLSKYQAEILCKEKIVRIPLSSG